MVSDIWPEGWRCEAEEPIRQTVRCSIRALSYHSAMSRSSVRHTTGRRSLYPSSEFVVRHNNFGQSNLCCDETLGVVDTTRAWKNYVFKSGKQPYGDATLSSTTVDYIPVQCDFRRWDFAVVLVGCTVRYVCGQFVWLMQGRGFGDHNGVHCIGRVVKGSKSRTDMSIHTFYVHVRCRKYQTSWAQGRLNLRVITLIRW